MSGIRLLVDPATNVHRKGSKEGASPDKEVRKRQDAPGQGREVFRRKTPTCRGNEKYLGITGPRRNTRSKEIVYLVRRKGKPED